MRESVPHLLTTSEPVEIFQKHQDLFEHYAGYSVHVELSPKGLDTFAFDLEKNTIYLSPRFYVDKFTGEESDRFTVFAILHEIGHFREKLEMLREDKGVENFQVYLDRVKKDKAFALTDNLIADISINREVVDRTNKEFKEREKDLYKKDLFPETDLTKAPRHIQFGQALLREHRVPDEECLVDPIVREEIVRLQRHEKGDIVDIMTNPNISMSKRLKILDHYIMPVVERLKEMDIEDRKKDEDGGDVDPNEMFKDDYTKAEKGTMGPISDEETEKALKKAFEEFLEKNPEAKSLSQEKTKDQTLQDQEKQEAEELGVGVDDLRGYRKTKEELETILDTETQKSVIEELSGLFSRIISKRKADRWSSKSPLEEGPYLADPANIVAAFKSGSLRSHSWEDVYKKPKELNKYGEIELSFIFDRSGSMDDNNKKIEQRKAAVLIMEALSDFETQLRNAKRSGNLNQDLTMKSEIFSFQGSPHEDATPLKSLSPNLTEVEKIKIAKKLSSTGGGTTDFVPLGVIQDGVSTESVKKIKDGKLKKIIIVMTDGGSDNSRAVRLSLEGLHEKGVVVVGVGITKSGEPAIETYKPRSILAEHAQDLPSVLGNILKEHLVDL